MTIKIGCAPCCWGVEAAENPNYPSWGKVLDEAAQAGYKGLELGPYGYLPQNIELLKEELSKRKLMITAGTLYDDLHSGNNFEELKEKTIVTCKLLSGLNDGKLMEGQKYGTPYLVVIDEVNSFRSKFAGHPKEAPRLESSDWNRMMNQIKELCKMAWQDYGVRPVLHPHAGGYIEYADEIELFMQEIDYETIGLCLDSGHLYYACMDPVSWIHDNKERLDYVHFKDINLPVYQDVIKRRIGFFEACAENVMCPIGKGIIDYNSINKILKEDGYSGWITIEQERDPKDCDTSLEDIKQSLDYLKSVGY